MIKIEELTEDDINRKVIYTSSHIKEEGIITSFNNSFIFVCFDGTGRGQACKPSDLEFTFKE